MKLLLCLVFVAIALGAHALTDEQQTKWHKWSDECRTQTGATAETVQKIRHNEFDIDDPKLEAHALCFGKKAGLVNEAGDLQLDNIKTKLKRVLTDEAEVDKLITKCAVKKEKPGQTVVETFICIRKAQPGFVPV